MKHIPTTASAKAKLQRQAKALAKLGVPYLTALDRVAKTAGFDHWAHVNACLKHPKPTKVSLSAGDEQLTDAEIRRRDYGHLLNEEELRLLRDDPVTLDTLLIDLIKATPEGKSRFVPVSASVEDRWSTAVRPTAGRPT